MEGPTIFDFGLSFPEDARRIHRAEMGIDTTQSSEVSAMAEFDETRGCPDCEQWLDLIDDKNRKLKQMLNPAGLLDIQDSVRYSFSDVDDALKNPEPYERKRALEEELRADVKALTLVLLAHQRKEHTPSVPENS